MMSEEATNEQATNEATETENQTSESQQQTAQNTDSESPDFTLASADEGDKDPATTSEESEDGGDADEGDALASAADEESGEEGGETESEVPETYSAPELPEGFKVSDSYMESMTPVFKELGMSQEAVGKLMKAHADHVQQTEGDRAEQIKDTWKGWLDSAKADKEIGGDSFKANVELANKAVNALGTTELKQLLKDYGLGNHPEFIRVFFKIGGLMKEDQPGIGDPTKATAKKGGKLEMLYPEDVPKQA